MKKANAIVIFIITILIISINTPVFATENYSIELKPSKQSLIEGDKIILEFYITDIVANPGIGAVYGELVYDEKVFEKVRQEDFIQSEGWEMPIYNDVNEAEGRWFLLREQGDLITEDSILFKLEMKVLDKVISQDTQIKVCAISASTAEQDVYTKDAILDLSVEGTLVPTQNITLVLFGVTVIAIIIIIVLVIKHKQ